MIRHFRCKETKALWETGKSRKFQKVTGIALRKLQMLNAADSLEILARVPGNRFEKLQGKRQDQYSIRINDQWRLCFEFSSAQDFEVEITDYH